VVIFEEKKYCNVEFLRVAQIDADNVTAMGMCQSETGFLNCDK
jgi:hypothetical protein